MGQRYYINYMYMYNVNVAEILSASYSTCTYLSCRHAVPACSVSIMYVPGGPAPALLTAITCTVYIVKGIRSSMVSMVTVIPPIVVSDVTPSPSNRVRVYSVMGRREKGASHRIVLERGSVTASVINGAPGGPVGVAMGVVRH